jgi:hypothetical protein
MTDQTGIEWPTCDEDGCIGVRLAATPKCLAHAGDEQRDTTLKQLGETGEIDARGVPITQALLEQILAAAPRDADDHPTFIAARFERAIFQGEARFGRATFEGDTRFDKATFQGDAGFAEATFQDGASFWRATFQDGAWFGGATFQDGASFWRATFQDGAWFGGASFQGSAGFAEATFQGDAWFGRATFQGDAEFGRVTFRCDAVFLDVRFEQARQLGPLLVYGVLRLDAAHFAQLIQIEVSARGLSCQRSHFPAGVQFRLRGAQIVLDDADLPSPSILVGIAVLSDAQLARREQRLVQAVRRSAPPAAVELLGRPRLLSVQGANVAGLTVSDVDLAQCRFAGAHNLDRLRLETKVIFSQAPGGLPWDWRRVIAEERVWRAARFKRRTPRWRAARSERWATPQWWPAWLNLPFGTKWPGVLPAGQVAGLYRALRKGREDAKDEPGAADFYYGEMEMRRHAGHPTDNPTGEVSGGQVERAILTVYWLVSGYGLRAWRALAWLAALTAGFAVAFHLAGFTRPPQPESYWTSLLYAFRATLSLTDDEVKLTAWGKLLQALLRLTGPVLLALTLLAIRARTKR